MQKSLLRTSTLLSSYRIRQSGHNRVVTPYTTTYYIIPHKACNSIVWLCVYKWYCTPYVEVEVATKGIGALRTPCSTEYMPSS